MQRRIQFGLAWIALIPLLSFAQPTTLPHDPRAEILAQILAQKAQGQVDPALYAEYFGDQTREEGNPLDQGGETFASATMIPVLPYNDNGTTAIAVHNYDTNFGGCPISTAKDVVYRYQPPLPQQVVAELCGSSYDTKLMVYENNSATPVACNDDACDLSSRVSVAMSPPNIYYIVVDGYSATDFGPYMIVVHEDTPCDIVIPPNALHECAFEEINSNHAKKDCNGGCNNETIDGLYDFDRYDGICSGSMVAGECFTYFDEEGFNLRDTDWFLFKMETTGPVNLTAQTEFDASVGIVNLNNCVSPSFVDFTTTPPCTPAALNVPSLAPGTYAVFIAPSGFSAVETPKDYLLDIVYPTLPSPCATCGNQEVEPNDVLALANVIPGPMMTTCGEISCPMDGDYFSFQMPHASAIRLHLRGNAAVGFCPEGQGLHPYCEIVTEDGEPIILAGDQTNQSTMFETDFKLGPYRYYFHVGGAAYTTGPYEIQIELIELNLVSCAPLTITLHAEDGGVNLRWQGAVLPTDQVRIYKQTDPNGPFTPFAVVPAIPASFFDPGSQPFEGFAVELIGGREPELVTPWVGSLLGLGEQTGPDGEYNEIGDYQITHIEWAVDQNNICVQTRLRAEGIGAVAGEAIDQNRREMFDQGWQAISSFQGHYISVNDRKVLVEHVAYARDPVNGDVGVVDGRGWNESGDTLMFFGDLKIYLHGDANVLASPWLGWLWWWWWDDWFCPSYCCRMKSIAFCTSSGSPTPPGCFSPPLTRCPCNPSCWLGCPCPPAPPPPDPANCCGPSVPPAPPTFAAGCDGCAFRVAAGGSFFIRYCQCPSDATPPTLPSCMFMIFVKCKTYCPCPGLFNICGCEVAVCPGPAGWTLVPAVTSAMRAACRKNCVLFGPGC